MTRNQHVNEALEFCAHCDAPLAPGETCDDDLALGMLHAMPRRHVYLCRKCRDELYAAST